MIFFKAFFSMPVNKKSVFVLNVILFLNLILIVLSVCRSMAVTVRRPATSPTAWWRTTACCFQRSARPSRACPESHLSSPVTSSQQSPPSIRLTEMVRRVSYFHKKGIGKIIDLLWSFIFG